MDHREIIRRSRQVGKTTLQRHYGFGVKGEPPLAPPDPVQEASQILTIVRQQLEMGVRGAYVQVDAATAALLQQWMTPEERHAVEIRIT